MGQILVFPAIFSHRHWWTLQLGDYQALVDFTHDDDDLDDDFTHDDNNNLDDNNDLNDDNNDDINDEDLDDDILLNNYEDLDLCRILWRQKLPIRWYYRHWPWITVMNDIVELPKF